MRSTQLPVALVLTSLLSVAGCRCGDPSTSSRFGELNVIWRDVDGTRILNRDARYDFGESVVGDTVSMTVSVRNSGAAALTLDTLERKDGDAISITAARTTEPFFAAFAPASLEVAAQTDFTVTFTPSEARAYSTTLALTASGTRAEDRVATITLVGKGAQGACDVPDTLDFGPVPVGDRFSLSMTVKNGTAQQLDGSASPITGADATSFAYFPGSPQGDFPIVANGSELVQLTFGPTEKRLYAANVTVRAPGCPAKVVTLKGEGVDDVLTWSPTSLDFGAVSPGLEARREVVFVNRSNVPLTLRMVATGMPTDFTHAVPAGVDATVFTVPGHGIATPMHVACSPSGLGPRSSTLTFNTGLARTTSGAVSLKCLGGGPKVKVTPVPTLGFGRVGYFPGAAQGVSRRVVVQNVGTVPPTPDPTANLYLGAVVDGVPAQPPLFELSTANATTAPDEFKVALGSAYDPAKGLEAVAGRNSVDLLVTLLPQGVGPKAATLTIHTNDPMTPVVTVNLTADAASLPPCNFSVTPLQLNYGLVPGGATKDLAVVVKNLGTAPSDTCYLSGLDLGHGTNAAYSLVGGPVVEKELLAQESYTVTVRVAPTGAVPTTLTSLTGALTFGVSSPTTPQVSVPLLAYVGPSCLVVTPDPLDFGNTRIGCGTAARTFTVYNVCTANVTLTRFALQAAAGQAPGGPNCAGTVACPEFFLTSAPTIPTGGLALLPGASPVTFQGRYVPIDTGTDTGAVAIDVVQSGQSLTYLVGLQGSGDQTGQQTDTFAQSVQPKADILLVVDDSGSMADKQANLASNFASFIQYASAANVDYQIGVITTTDDTPTACPPFPIPGAGRCVEGQGKLVRRGTGAAQVGPFLGNATPQVATKFADLVNVGTDGSGTEQGLATAVKALTPPLSVGDNAGFVRPDANLAVVVISDAADQSNQPISYYQNLLYNVKGFNRLSMFTFSNIGPYLATPPTNCAYDDTSGLARYEAIVTATNGVRDEICTSSWSATLQGLGRTAFGFRTTFYLTSTPDLSNGHDILVRVAGVLVSSTLWTWDPAANAIVFQTNAAPQPGQALTVTYTPTCF